MLCQKCLTMQRNSSTQLQSGTCFANWTQHYNNRIERVGLFIKMSVCFTWIMVLMLLCYMHGLRSAVLPVGMVGSVVGEILQTAQSTAFLTIGDYFEKLFKLNAVCHAHSAPSNNSRWHMTQLVQHVHSS